jgi:nucleoside triphosphate diphosphatase
MTDRSSVAESDVAAALIRLDEITRRLRRECPWDREQDERSIVPHTVEEAYELADAAASGDDAKLLDELGDVLFQVHFLALLLEERGAGNLADVAGSMAQKLIRRHPHVFGETEAETAGEVLRNWDRIKREEEGRGAEDPFADVPENLPALLYARKMQRRAISASNDTSQSRGRTSPRITPGLAGEEAGERMPEPELRDEAERRIGEALFSLVDEARRLRVDPELALRAAADRFRDNLSNQDLGN